MPMSIPKLVERAHEQLKRITGFEFSSTVGIKQEKENWRITVELVEKHSIPDQMDILGLYDAIVDGDGDLIEFRRKNLRRRIDTEKIELEE